MQNPKPSSRKYSNNSLLYYIGIIKIIPAIIFTAVTLIPTQATTKLYGGPSHKLVLPGGRPQTRVQMMINKPKTPDEIAAIRFALQDQETYPNLVGRLQANTNQTSEQVQITIFTDEGWDEFTRRHPPTHPIWGELTLEIQRTVPQAPGIQRSAPSPGVQPHQVAPPYRPPPPYEHPQPATTRTQEIPAQLRPFPPGHEIWTRIGLILAGPQTDPRKVRPATMRDIRQAVTDHRLTPDQIEDIKAAIAVEQLANGPVPGDGPSSGSGILPGPKTYPPPPGDPFYDSYYGPGYHPDVPPEVGWGG
jgi:hypothetical protein